MYSCSFSPLKHHRISLPFYQTFELAEIIRCIRTISTPKQNDQFINIVVHHIRQSSFKSDNIFLVDLLPISSEHSAQIQLSVEDRWSPSSVKGNVNVEGVLNSRLALHKAHSKSPYLS